MTIPVARFDFSLSCDSGNVDSSRRSTGLSAESFERSAVGALYDRATDPLIHCDNDLTGFKKLFQEGQNPFGLHA
jgi:hypothetical protein